MVLMPPLPELLPWAVHLSDGFLADPWWIGGFVLLAPLLFFGAWRMQEDDIPRTALLTAAFFVASSIHIRVTPFSTTHLLLNGLIGVVLGRRAALAIPLGLFFQYVFTGHGGLTTLGINSCIQVLPALAAGQLFAGLRRLPWVCRPWFRYCLVAGSASVWLLSLVYAVTLLVTNRLTAEMTPDFGPANELTFNPAVILGAVLLAQLAAWSERRLENAPEFPLGLVVGEVAVLLTVALWAVVALFGALPEMRTEGGWHLLVMVQVVAHLPLAVLEGIILGFTVGFLARVKPEMLGWLPPEKTPCSVDSLP